MTVSFCNLVLTRNTFRCWRHNAENYRGLRCSRTLLVDHIVMRSSFRLWRHRTEKDWTELRSKSRFVDRWRKQYLTRHAFDLWYLDMLKTVSRRAVRVLLFVRHWQRRDWDKWVARFRHRTLAATFLRLWLTSWHDMPEAGMSSSDDVPEVCARVTSSAESDSSGDMVRVFEMVAAVRVRRHCFVRRSRRDWL